MKTFFLLILLLASIAVSCHQEVNPSDYWGCWTTRIDNTFDIVLEENQNGNHYVSIGFECATELVIADRLEILEFRNDTLRSDHLPNYDMWFHLEGEIMYYSTFLADASGIPPGKLYRK